MIGAALASSLAQVGLAGATREYPHKLDHVYRDAADARTPRDLHPAFYGCYDWHSAVHTHWMLARLWRVHPDLPEVPRIAALFDAHFAPAPLAAELAYIEEPGRAGFERPYGWAWLFQLTAEMAALDADSRARAWHARLAPIASTFAARFIDHLPRQTYPIRAGTHVNTAFALGLAWDYAKACSDTALETAVRLGALRFYDADRDGPANFEPSGNDFLSPCLIEADLMTRFHDPVNYARWLARFLPGFVGGIAARLLEPAVVSDRADAQGVHLDGLNLSRAWCLARIADHLPESDPRRRALQESARRHRAAGLKHVTSGDFLAEHWLGSFATYALTMAPDDGALFNP
jgi:hypothetical protein